MQCGMKLAASLSMLAVDLNIDLGSNAEPIGVFIDDDPCETIPFLCM